MTLLSRLGILVLFAVLGFSPSAWAVDVWTVGVNNTRQGWNKSETVLTTANVPRLRKIREFVVDENTAACDGNIGHDVALRRLAWVWPALRAVSYFSRNSSTPSLRKSGRARRRIS